MNDNQLPGPLTTPGKRWAYRTIEVRTNAFSGKTSKLDELNAAGAEGWDAVGVTGSSGNNYQVLFKRECSSGSTERLR